MELIAAHSVSSPEPVQLFSNHRNIFVQDENAAYRVENHHMNPLLKEVMVRQAMGKFTDSGYIRVKQLSNGQYALEAKMRGDGGGPILATATAIGIRAVGYSSFIIGIFATQGELLLHTAEITQCIEIAANSASTAALVAPTP